jgi:predicted metalloendopeptidase
VSHSNAENQWFSLYHRVLANYVMSRVAGASVNYLNDELRNRQLKFSTTLSGKTEREARWKECIDIVSGG